MGDRRHRPTRISIAAWAISSGVVGTFGFWAFVGHDPVVAAEMINASRGNAVGFRARLAHRRV